MPGRAIPLAAGLAAGLMAAGFPAASEVPALDDAHLAVVLRTAAETARIARVLAPPTGFTAAQPFEALSGGAATSKALVNNQAFSHFSANTPFDRQASFSIGNALFQKLWVTAPSSTKGSDGLGPFYNARSCQRCHLLDGRGYPPSSADDDSVSMILQLSMSGGDPIAAIPGYFAALPDPVYGRQLQDFAAPGLTAEFHLGIAYQEIPVALAGGETASLRKPTYGLNDLAYGPLDPKTLFSPRIAPPMIGVGLLEAIPAADILAHADPDDANGDGISGRPNIVWSQEFGKPMLGRFGWKAGQPTVRSQAATAFSNDLGISSPMRPEAWGDCTAAEPACRAAPQGAAPGETEIGDQEFDTVAFYSRNLAVPMRRDIDAPQVLHGKQVFYQAGCPACHTPAFVTNRLVGQPEQSFQLIWPYTDLLLHDMGDGLADGRPEGRATGSEWRTPPLWGIGLTRTVGGEETYLHDGRARSVLEAILWHGGEAQPARDRVAALAPADRAALLTFLGSL